MLTLVLSHGIQGCHTQPTPWPTLTLVHSHVQGCHTQTTPWPMCLDIASFLHHVIIISVIVLTYNFNKSLHQFSLKVRLKKFGFFHLRISLGQNNYLCFKLILG